MAEFEGKSIFIKDPSVSPAWQEKSLSTLAADIAPDIAGAILPFVTVGFGPGFNYECDGVADNVQIQAAINAASDAGGGSVYIAPGNYDIVHTMTPKTNVNVVGSGWGTIFNQSVSSIYFFQGISKSNFTIKDIQFNGNRTLLTGNDSFAIRLVTCLNVTLENLLVKSMRADGIHLREDSQNIKVINCVLTDNGENAIATTMTRDIHIENCVIYANGTEAEGGNGIKIGASEGPDAAHGTPQTIVIGNSIYNNTQNGIYSAYASGFLISGNNIYSNAFSGISGRNSNNSLIEGNNIFANSRSGIEYTDSSYIDYADNAIFNNDQGATTNSGISLKGTSDRNNISNNSIYDSQGSPTQDYGINIHDATVTNTLIQDNSILNSAIARIIDSGTSTAVIHYLQVENKQGIGTFNPVATQDIVSSQNANADINDKNNYTQRLQHNSDVIGRGPGLVFGSSSGGEIGSSVYFIRQGALSYGDLAFATKPNAGALIERMRIASTGNIGIGVTSPSASIHIKPGTSVAGTAPIKLSSGVSLTTPENGTLEFDGTNLYFTVAGVRKIVNLT